MRIVIGACKEKEGQWLENADQTQQSCALPALTYTTNEFLLLLLKLNCDELSSPEIYWKVTFLLSLVAAASLVPDTDDDGDDDADADDELRSSSKQQFIILISVSS